MARENRVRLSDGELAKVERAREQLFPGDASEEVSLGATIGQVMDEFLGDSNE